MFGVLDIIIIIAVVVGLILVGLYFLNKWASKKMGDQQNLIDKSKTPASIYVIDKAHDKAANVTLPKSVSENLPKTYKFLKMYFVKAKIGPQIITFMCDKKVFNALQPKKNYKVEIAGIYIVSVKGMRTETELKQMAKDKKAKEKAAQKELKAKNK